MEIEDRNLIFEDIPLFSGLNKEELEFVKEHSSFLELTKGQIVYEENSPADAFYCVVFGRVVIYTLDNDKNRTVLEYLHRGKYFGIISLLTGDNHSVTAQALNDCLLLMIKKDDFDLILKNIPRLAIDLSLSLSRRLKDKDLHQKIIFETTVISVFSSHSLAGKTVYSLNLALSLSKETKKKVMILEVFPEDGIHSLPNKFEITSGYKPFNTSKLMLTDSSQIGGYILKNRFGIDLMCVYYKPEDKYFLKQFVKIISFLVNDYNYIIVDLPTDMDIAVFNILNQSDLIHILTCGQEVDLEKTRHLIDRLKSEFHFLENKIKIIINEYKSSKLSYEQQKEFIGGDIFATLPKMEFGSTERMILDNPFSEYSKAVRRISRNLGDCQVGLALGVGFAYGFCHIGVLKVIEEEGIPIDVISGSSIGALIAALWATGRSAEEIAEIIAREFKEPKFIWQIIDLTFPRLGFIKGNKLYRFFKKYLGNKTFHDIRLPLCIIASDVKRKESRVINSGLLIDAVMASCSMPGVFTPFRLKEELLLDGGVINPLPTEILFKMGMRKIIAVNVTPSKEDVIKQYNSVKNNFDGMAVKSIKKAGFSIRNYLKEKFKNNILDLIFSSIEMMQSEMAGKEAQLADIVLHPDTKGLYWLELHKVEDFAKRGEQEARANLEKIKQLVNE
ncbi:MAG: hypothetical protein C4533_01175 [Candidatus Omnitrophota bacterium]|jgi:NTE family protein|nr:MAG: hypothetical protein C4533_01175 [Candidatus Omnitrophota bacterium]